MNIVCALVWADKFLLGLLVCVVTNVNWCMRNQPVFLYMMCHYSVKVEEALGSYWS